LGRNQDLELFSESLFIDIQTCIKYNDVKQLSALDVPGQSGNILKAGKREYWRYRIEAYQ